MNALLDEVKGWIFTAHAKLKSGDLHAADLDDFLQTISRRSHERRQKLLYLHAQSPSIYSSIVSMAQHDAERQTVAELDVDMKWPYDCVHDAIKDGWQVIHFPLQSAPFDDREIDIMGYEFILQKLEAS